MEPGHREPLDQLFKRWLDFLFYPLPLFWDPVPRAPENKNISVFSGKKIRKFLGDRIVLRIHTKMCCETQIIFAKKSSPPYFFHLIRAVQLAFSSLFLTVSY